MDMLNAYSAISLDEKFLRLYIKFCFKVSFFFFSPLVLFHFLGEGGWMIILFAEEIGNLRNLGSFGDLQ